MVQYAETQHAIDKGLESLDPDKGVELIEKWEDALKDWDGGKTVARDLAALKTALKAKTPDPDKIKGLLKKLGQETSEAADDADGAAPEKLRDIGEGLQQAAR